jgi:hypothetical protein
LTEAEGHTQEGGPEPEPREAAGAERPKSPRFVWREARGWRSPAALDWHEWVDGKGLKRESVEIYAAAVEVLDAGDQGEEVTAQAEGGSRAGAARLLYDVEAASAGAA